MAFDWSSFTTNFLNTISTGINERLEAADDERDLLNKEYKEAQTVFKNRRKLVDNGIMLAGKARSLGANDMQIKAAISSGEKGLPTFVKALEKFSAAKGGTNLSTSEVDTLVEGAELFETGDVNEFLQRSYGLLADEADRTQLEDSRTTFQKLFAVDPKISARAAFDPDRMSMIELARQDAYDSLASDRGSVYLTVDQAMANVYDPIKTNESFDREMNSAVKLIKETEAYKKIAITDDDAAKKMERDAQLFVMEKYINLYGEPFIKGLVPGAVPKELLAIAEVSSDGIQPTKSTLSTRLANAAAADMATTISEVQGNKTVRYNVDANGLPIGPIVLINKNGKMVEVDQSRLPEIKQMGFELKDLSVPEVPTPEKTYYRKDGEVVDGVPPRPDLGIGNVLGGIGLSGEDIEEILAGERPIPANLRPGQWDELFGDTHDPETGERLAAPKGAVGLGSPTRKGQDQDPNLEGPLASGLPQSGFDSAASDPEKSMYKDDGTIDEAIRGIPEGSFLAGEPVTVEELPPADVETGRVKKQKPEIQVLSTQTIGRQSFTVTPDGKVYINHIKTGRPKSEVTDPAVKEQVIQQNKEFMQNAITVFFNDAKEKGFVNDKARLLEYWTRFSGKNRLSSYVIEQVKQQINERL
tara:strand:- start:461 stop:2386 length:1926 start_codon:yes stop_codon:yes gene_type:complete